MISGRLAASTERVDAAENAGVAMIKRRVFQAMTCLRAAANNESNTIAWSNTEVIDVYSGAFCCRGENLVPSLHDNGATVETNKLTSRHGFFHNSSNRADRLAKEVAVDLDVIFNKIAPSGKKKMLRRSRRITLVVSVCGY